MKQLKFLLPKDVEEKERLERYIQINENYKIPNKDVEVEFVYEILDLKKELDYRSYIHRREYTEDEFVKDEVKKIISDRERILFYYAREWIMREEWMKK